MISDALKRLDTICGEARLALENLRRRTAEEIHNYPSPIAGCDLQFNHLLQQRTEIAAELHRLAQISERRARVGEYAEALDEFLRSCTCIDERTIEELRAGLKTAVAEPAAAERASHR